MAQILTWLCLSLDEWKDVATIVATVVGVFTFYKAVLEYTRQQRAKQAESFFAIRKKLDEDKDYLKLIKMIDTDKELLRAVDPDKKRDFLAYLEEVALLVNSDLIPIAVAYYMFGYYAIAVWDSDEYWANLDEGRDDPFWSVLKDFVVRLKNFQQKTPPEKLVSKVKFRSVL